MFSPVHLGSTACGLFAVCVSVGERALAGPMVAVEGTAQTSLGTICCEEQVTDNPAATLGTPITSAPMLHFPGCKAKCSRVLGLSLSCQGTLAMGHLSRRLAGDQWGPSLPHPDLLSIALQAEILPTHFFLSPSTS